MEVNNELVKKFLKNECSEKEAVLIQAYFENHPEELENYIPLKDWLTGKYSLYPAVSKRILQQIRKKYEQKETVPVTRYLIRYAVAAILTGVIFFGGIKLFRDEEKNIPAKNTIVTNSNIGSVQMLKTIKNKTGKTIQISLPDGSLITVYPNSSLKYLPSFETNKRELYLTGKVHFKVFKDASRPFTVYSSGIATTALGTSFIVSELKDEKVSVHLLEGKVKVWQTATNGNKFVLLLPGDEMVVNNDKFDDYTLSHKTVLDRTFKIKEATNVDDKEITELAFKNTSLREVFKKVKEKFGVTINYETTIGIDKKLFTGKFLETDNLEFVCKVLCNSQGLQYKIEDKVVIISSK